MTNHRLILNIFISSINVVAALALIALLNGPAPAQSGRRSAPKSSSVPAPTPTPETAPVDKDPAAKTRATISFIIGMDRVANFTSVPDYLNESVLKECAEGLEAGPSVTVNVANRDMNRGEAIKKAKAETESHVVWMQLRFDNSQSVGNEDLSQLYIDYSVFAPTTGKVVTNGRSYQQLYRGGGVIVMPRPGGRANLPYTEQLLKQAAREAAERILSAMQLRGRSVPGLVGS